MLMKMIKLSIVLRIFVFVQVTLIGQTSVNLKNEFGKTLFELCNSLQKKQLLQIPDANFGAINCSECNLLHTRAAESVYPFLVAYKITGEENYFISAISLADWLIKQQQPDGSWKETPEEWTGTTTDQLFMLVLSYEQIKDKLDKQKSELWLNSIKKAADYLTAIMDNSFASINYCATTTASLSATYNIIPDIKYIEKAKSLAVNVISKMDEDGFINGEGGKTHNAKYGVDLGYDLEMSLWGLAYYSKISNDTLVFNKVFKSVYTHLNFIYPDGSMDNSWGIRSNKWTSYGSATSDGSQILFTLFADFDEVFATAAYKNLLAIRRSIFDGLLTYGPHYNKIFENEPCIYPTFAKAKNLALAFDLANDKEYSIVKLPTEKKPWMKEFKSLDLVEIRTKLFMATITGYRYKDILKGSKSKYMYRPTGGSISSLWLEDYGFLQAGSQTVYNRWEPMHFPNADNIKCLTPRIEFTDTLGYFTNLFEFDSRMISKSLDENSYLINALGELKDMNQLNGGVGYKFEYLFTDSSIEKSVTLFYRDITPTVKIIEPIIENSNVKFTLVNPKTVLIESDYKILEFKLMSDNAELQIGNDKEKYWAPFPSLKAFPIELMVLYNGELSNEIKYKIRVIK